MVGLKMQEYLCQYIKYNHYYSITNLRMWTFKFQNLVCRPFHFSAHTSVAQLWSVCDFDPFQLQMHPPQSKIDWGMKGTSEIRL